MSKKQIPAIPSRGRPALSDKEIANMRQHIADCALRLFQDSGYEAVSMRRLAREADCTAMTIYRYFDRKIDILRALWANVFDELFNELDQIAAREDHTSNRLNAVAFAYVNFWLTHRENYFLVFMSSGISQTDVSIFVGDEPMVKRFGVLRESLASALEPEISDADIELKAQLLLCALNGISQSLITISAYPWSKPDDLVRAAVKAILH